MSTKIGEPLTLSTCVSQFILDRKTIGRSKKTIQFYESELGYFTKWLTKNQYSPTLTTLTPDVLRKYFVDLSTHRNKGGVHCAYRVVKVFLNWVCYENDLEKNPIKKVKVQANNIEPLPEIPLDDVQKLLDACSSKYKLRDTAIIKTLIDTGVRANELISLNVSDVNLNTGQVKVLHGKGDKFRTVWLGEKSKRAIKNYLDSKPNLTPTSPIFTNENGERLKFAGLRQIILRLCHRAVVREYGLHCFRRTFALTMHRKGVDIVTISRLLGHSKIEVTRRYLNVSNEDLREAHAKASPADCLD